jgi:hypothetical protein
VTEMVGNFVEWIPKAGMKLHLGLELEKLPWAFLVTPRINVVLPGCKTVSN